MGYSLYIERENSPIPTEEWEAAVDATDGIRLASRDKETVTNPKTGEAISIKMNTFDVELFLPEMDQWILAIMWSEDRGFGSFNARGISAATDFGDLDDPGWKAISSLARALSAQIRGEEGEVYNLDNAQPNRA
ncbi:MAG: hypothetical protein MI807_13410 [Verrucomicrobiales bacterium]|nr:hypothetical protein [Verrucomicrobiales bacterium]